MSKIITITASARHGKDTSAEFIAKALREKHNKKVVLFHYADFLKFIAKQWYDWDGNKDEAGRTLLQYLGTDVFRKNRPDCWVNMAKEFVLGLGDTVDYVIIPDCRFPNEIEVMKDIDPAKFRCIKVFRPNFDNGLTYEQKHHKSETALNEYTFDYLIINDGDLEELESKCESLAKVLEQI